MENNAHPTFGHGKICYLEIPADDISQSADFYSTVFGWKIRDDSDGNLSFDDAVGEVSGMWVTGRLPATEVGIIISIMVNDIKSTLNMIVSKGGDIIQTFDETANEKIARFTDPFGNLFGLYEHRQ